jgi:hypothetical protein
MANPVLSVFRKPEIGVTELEGFVHSKRAGLVKGYKAGAKPRVDQSPRNLSNSNGTEFGQDGL